MDLPTQTITDLDRHVAAIRRFNRFYTPLVGLLNEHYLDSSLSLTQVRVLYELARRGRTTAAELVRDLGIDRGYLSRLLHELQRDGLVDRIPSPSDGRRQHLSLTDAGRRLFAKLDARSHEAIAGLLARYAPADQQRVVEAMAAIELTLGDEPKPMADFVLREPQPGDFGWIVQRHGALYAREYGWNETFEALVAQIVADFAGGHDRRCERCWIAELGGQNVGSVLCVRKSEAVAQLRLLLVEPHARGLGIGSRLVQECIDFARSAGYRSMMLWTNDVLVSARRIYEAAGFRLVAEETHQSFGHALVGQNWELSL